MDKVTTGLLDDLPPKLLSLKEFRDGGYLLELNRQFLNPLGLGLALETDDDGNPVALAGIVDWREEGIAFTNFTEGDFVKARKVRQEWCKRAEQRIAQLGAMIQPIDG